MEVFRHAEMCPRRISTRRIRIWGRKLPILTVRVEKLTKTSDKIFGFLLIAHTGSHGFGPDLVGIFPRSLPQLSKQLRDQNNNRKLRKTRKIEIQLQFCLYTGGGKVTPLILFEFDSSYLPKFIWLLIQAFQNTKKEIEMSDTAKQIHSSTKT